jgi:hypothetical protein
MPGKDAPAAMMSRRGCGVFVSGGARCSRNATGRRDARPSVDGAIDSSLPRSQGKACGVRRALELAVRAATVESEWSDSPCAIARPRRTAGVHGE